MLSVLPVWRASDRCGADVSTAIASPDCRNCLVYPDSTMKAVSASRSHRADCSALGEVAQVSASAFGYLRFVCRSLSWQGKCFHFAWPRCCRKLLLFENFLRGRLFLKRARQGVGPPFTAHWQRLGGNHRHNAGLAGERTKNIVRTDVYDCSKASRRVLLSPDIERAGDPTPARILSFRTLYSTKSAAVKSTRPSRFRYRSATPSPSRSISTTVWPPACA